MNPNGHIFCYHRNNNNHRNTTFKHCDNRNSGIPMDVKPHSFFLSQEKIMANDTSKLITPGIKFTGEDGKQYETTGEFRVPKGGEWVVGENGNPKPITYESAFFYPILRELPLPAPPRRVPTDADAIHRPRCWVRDHEDDEWSVPTRLVAVLNRESHKFPFSVINFEGVSAGCWAFCEIEDVPLGPVYHWRDATEADVGMRPEAILFPNGTKGFGFEILRNVNPRTKVLVEVGK